MTALYNILYPGWRKRVEAAWPGVDWLHPCGQGKQSGVM